MKIASKIKLLSSLCGLSLLAACGDSTTVNTETGTFMKGQASGVIYTTETHTGVTDENGGYEYEPGENISFYIGGTQLGSTVAASAAIGPMELVPGVTIPESTQEVKQFFDIEGNNFGENASLDLQYELMNILMFLYSADKDKVASNGIVINPATHATFASNSYDLKIRSSRFDNINGIEYKFYDAFNAGAMDSARIIRRWKALDDFAALEGLSPQVLVWESYIRDDDADGVIDYTDMFTFDSRRLFSGVTFEGGSYSVVYDDYGDTLSNLSLQGPDTYTGATTRDVHGNILTRSEAENGVVLFTSIFTYDGYGNPISESGDNDDDGVVDWAYTYEYDAMGNQTLNSYDSDGDGNPDELYIYAYDSNGYRIFQSNDYDGDGSPERIYEYVYDANGNQLYYSRDQNGDGNPEQIYTYTYDANDNYLSGSSDNNGDGTVDEIETYTYDSNGNEIEYTEDEDADGTIDYIETYTYDSNGNEIEYTEDEDADGNIDFSRTYTYDSMGNLLLREQDNNGDGTVNSVYAYEYDANSNRTLQTRDYTNDGTLDYIYIYNFDANNNKIYESRDSNGDGNPERIYTYEYDANNNQTLYAYDSNGDGVNDRIYAYTYQAVNFLGWYTFD